MAAALRPDGVGHAPTWPQGDGVDRCRTIAAHAVRLVVAVAAAALVVRLGTGHLDRRKSVVVLDHLAHHDPLTGLPNRRAIDRLTTGAFPPEAPGTAVWVAVGDLDRFKAVNDTRGLAAGDALLRSVAGCLVASVRSGDVVARLGGDEFVVVLHDCVATDAFTIARRLAERAGGIAGGCTMSFGIVPVSDRGPGVLGAPVDLVGAVSRAADALRHAKAGAPGAVVAGPATGDQPSGRLGGSSRPEAVR